MLAVKNLCELVVIMECADNSMIREMNNTDLNMGTISRRHSAELQRNASWLSGAITGVSLGITGTILKGIPGTVLGWLPAQSWTGLKAEFPAQSQTLTQERSQAGFPA